jgi:hypothetical protein
MSLMNLTDTLAYALRELERAAAGGAPATLDGGTLRDGSFRECHSLHTNGENSNSGEDGEDLELHDVK